MQVIFKHSLLYLLTLTFLYTGVGVSMIEHYCYKCDVKEMVTSTKSTEKSTCEDSCCEQEQKSNAQNKGCHSDENHCNLCFYSAPSPFEGGVHQLVIKIKEIDLLFSYSFFSTYFFPTHYSQGLDKYTLNIPPSDILLQTSVLII